MVARLLLALLPLGFVAGCSPLSHPGSQSALPSTAQPATALSPYIKHVVVIIQENRSFENFFAGFPGANAPTFGHAINHIHRRVTVTLHQTTFETNPNLPHTWESALTGWHKGKMNGFHIGSGHDYAAYAYVDHAEIAPYWAMAQRYVLADAMFPTEFGGSYTAHLTAVAGTDNMSPTVAQVNYPTHAPNDCDSPPGTRSSLVKIYRKVGAGDGPFPCFTQFNTMAEVLDGAGISWHYYATRLLDAGIWSPFEAIAYVRYGPDWNSNIIAPQTRVLIDVAEQHLAQMNWVTPSHADSDHPGAHSDKGPSWVTSIVNAIGESSYWQTSAIIVIWDDWGGWFDNAPPPQLDFRGLGIRVPCLIISPYARRGSSSQGGYVSHTPYEFGSILRFIEQVFNLPYIGPTAQGYTDARADSIIDSFDFTQPPRPFRPFALKYPPSYFRHEVPSNEPVDEN
jgi:phospholipase C